MRLNRDFRPGLLYGVTQRGNQGQWVYRDAADFEQALLLMRVCAARYKVKIHGWCLLHNHGHWVFEASTAESISNVMRDMQSQFSRYLNTKYQKKPWLLLGPLRGRKRRSNYSPFRRAGPVN
jgi:REP element-mobilizing transposase RayT